MEEKEVREVRRDGGKQGREDGKGKEGLKGYELLNKPTEARVPVKMNKIDAN